MKNNEQFAVAIHILSYLALTDKQYVTSEEIAQSVNTSSVVIRRIIKSLKASGLIETKQGIGGSKLAKSPHDIRLFDVYTSMNQMLEFGLHHNTNDRCPIGNQINDAIAQSLQESYDAFKLSLKKKSIADIVHQLDHVQ